MSGLTPFRTGRPTPRRQRIIQGPPIGPSSQPNRNPHSSTQYEEHNRALRGPPGPHLIFLRPDYRHSSREIHRIIIVIVGVVVVVVIALWAEVSMDAGWLVISAACFCMWRACVCVSGGLPFCGHPSEDYLSFPLAPPPPLPFSPSQL